MGIFRESDGTYITIDFENAGIKKFGMNSIGTTLMVVEEKAEKVVAESKPISQTTYVPVNAQNGALIQYDGESGSIAGKNIIEAFEGNDSVIFNESYIIIGEHTEALKIHAMYDLTIMGDVTAQECVVNGSLTVIGKVSLRPHLSLRSTPPRGVYQRLNRSCPVAVMARTLSALPYS